MLGHVTGMVPRNCFLPTSGVQSTACDPVRNKLIRVATARAQRLQQEQPLLVLPRSPHEPGPVLAAGPGTGDLACARIGGYGGILAELRPCFPDLKTCRLPGEVRAP